MKKIAFIAIMSFFALTLPAKTIFIKGNYSTFNGKRISLNWQAVHKGDKVKLFLDGKFKAEITMKNGKITKITEVKKFAGKERLFTITSPEKIKLELKSSFYPFFTIYEFLFGKKTEKTKIKNSTFEIIGVKE